MQDSREPEGPAPVKRHLAEAEADRKKRYGAGNHGPRAGAAFCRGIEALQHRLAGKDGFVASTVWRARRHLAGPGTRQIRAGIQTNNEGDEKVHRDFEPANALSPAQGATHRRIPQPALAPPCRTGPTLRQSKLWKLSGPT